MRIDLIISQLRQFAPELKVVGGAADYALGLESVVNPAKLPAAFVLPLDDTAGDNELQTGLRQNVIERCQIILETDNSPDRRGQTAVMSIEDLRYCIYHAILNWRLDPIRAQKGLQYSGGRLVSMDRARLWWALEFEQSIVILDEDGWIPPSEPLVEIHVDVWVEPEIEPIVPPQSPLEVGIVLHPPHPPDDFPSPGKINPLE